MSGIRASSLIGHCPLLIGFPALRGHYASGPTATGRRHAHHSRPARPPQRGEVIVREGGAEEDDEEEYRLQLCPPGPPERAWRTWSRPFVVQRLHVTSPGSSSPLARNTVSSGRRRDSVVKHTLQARLVILSAAKNFPSFGTGEKFPAS